MIKPEDLLACVEAMTDEQRARFCELVDPAHPDAIEADVDAARSIEGPAPGSREHAEMFGDCGREPVFRSLFRPPSPETVAKFLYRQMTHKDLVLAAPKGAMMDDVELANTETVEVSKADIVQRDRWMNARTRWEKLFGEAQIPIIRDLKNPDVTLDAVEALLYDKETKGINPARCACGCGYVGGCGML